MMIGVTVRAANEVQESHRHDRSCNLQEIYKRNLAHYFGDEGCAAAVLIARLRRRHVLALPDVSSISLPLALSLPLPLPPTLHHILSLSHSLLLPKYFYLSPLEAHF